jgi:NAD(P)-dependent dehydrogenase (short-subunit alcohol dehydrogenase family)
MGTFQDQTAVVTGAATGIGRAIAAALAREGAQVALWDKDSTTLSETVEQLRSEGHRVTAHVVDVADRTSVIAAIAALHETFSTPVSLLVNNAGIGTLAPLPKIDPDDFRRTLDVNVMGSFNCLQLMHNQLVETSGAVVNLSSWFGKSGRPFAMPYSASKGAVIAMTQSAAQELARYGVRVNAICPGTIDQTEMRERAESEAAALGLPAARDRTASIPLGRLGLPDDVARVACFLLSPAASYMTGQAINVTGGLWMT